MGHTCRRIACLQPSATVILAAIGELDRVAACTRYCGELIPEVNDGSRTILADSWTAETSEIVAVQPDLVIAAVPYQEKAVGEILKAGTRFLGLAPKTLADIYTDMVTIAGAVGALNQGEELVRNMQRRIDEVRKRVEGTARPRVFCEEWGKPIIASQPWVAELVETCRWGVCWHAGETDIRGGGNARRSASFHRGVVWSGRAGSFGEDCRRSRLAEKLRRTCRQGFLYQRRLSEHACSHAFTWVGRSGLCHSSGIIPEHERNPADYRGFCY